jgi:ArsR family transcriptional regulator, lead/cadmium/zinc/bismuth-responsive transcriptional repressor
VASPKLPECEHPGPHRTPPVNEAALERAARIFRALGDVPRLRLLAVLAQGGACVTELAASAQENLSTVSQRLRVLRAEDIVVRRRRGKHIDYYLADQHMLDLIFNALAHASESRPVPPAAQPDEEET